ncbi:MAG: hypothetical protein Q8T03_12070 [Bacteroidota bacterium]|nr:hypothetical protein [Bacteroidota bacterium]
MKKYTYEMSFNEKDNAEGEKEADLKADGLATLGAKLTGKEIQRLKQVVLNEPTKLALAKKALGL